MTAVRPAEHLNHDTPSVCREPEQFSRTLCEETGRKGIKESRTIIQSSGGNTEIWEVQEVGSPPDPPVALVPDSSECTTVCSPLLAVLNFLSSPPPEHS